MGRYIPQKGDLITIYFDPHAGHEQKGRRPAIVLSNDLFNEHTGLAIVCPITNTNRGFPFHLPLPNGTRLTGFVMAEQVRSIDHKARKARLVERAPTTFVKEVLELINACLR
ncbi:MAG: type II toxin-antitoxin system PemK/MazF family toxin [Acidobacteriota bacterium]|nr:MAG: type II toxin-antitoxin system PemK/MazF family toxin [Acidobacteriota bacterium]